MSAEGVNLWTSLLRDSAKRIQAPESTCILVGDAASGKKSLLDVLCKYHEKKSDGETDKKSILHFNYYDVEEGDLETSSRVNIWSFNHNMFSSGYEIIGKSNHSNKVIMTKLHCQLLLVLNLFFVSSCFF